MAGYEAHCESVFHSHFAAAGMGVRAGESGSRGRADMARAVQRQRIPASCKKNRHLRAFPLQNMGFSGRPKACRAVVRPGDGNPSPHPRPAHRTHYSVGRQINPLHERQRRLGRGTPTCPHGTQCRRLVDVSLRRFMRQSGYVSRGKGRRPGVRALQRSAKRRRWKARVGPSMVGLRPAHLGAALRSRRPPCEAVRAAGGKTSSSCAGRRATGRRANTCRARSRRRSAGPQAGVRTNVPTDTGGWPPPLRYGADALRAIRPEVGTAKPGGRTACRNGFVADLDVTHDNVAEIAACGRARRRIGNGTFNVPEPTGTDRGTISDTGAGARQPVGGARPAGLRRAYRLRPGRGARQRARRTPGARKRLSGHMRTPAAHVVSP